MALGGNLVTAQLASLIGLYGLTVIAILMFSAPAVLGDKSSDARSEDAGCPRQSSPPPLSLAAFADLAHSVWRSQLPRRSHGVRLRIMQPNLPQDAKFRPENKAWILNALSRLVDARG